MIRCPNCGAQYEDGTGRCALCGTALDAPAAGSGGTGAAPHGVLGSMGRASFRGTSGTGATPAAEERTGGVSGKFMGRMGGAVFAADKGEKSAPAADGRSGVSGMERLKQTLRSRADDKSWDTEDSMTASGAGGKSWDTEDDFGRSAGTGRRKSGSADPSGGRDRSWETEDTFTADALRGSADTNADRTRSTRVRDLLWRTPDAIPYRRSPRLKKMIPEMQVEIESPPVIGEKPEINWLSTLMPVVISVMIAVVAMVIMTSPMMLLFSVPMAVSGVVVTVINYKKQKKKFADQERNRVTVYDQHLSDAVRRIEEGQRVQLDALWTADPDTMQCFRTVEQGDSSLWDRSPRDSDFCSVRIGSGVAPSAVTVKTPRMGLSLKEDELLVRAEQIRVSHAYVQGAPIVCDLRGSRICGVVGPHAESVALIRNMLVQYATRQCYTEARIICIYDEEDRGRLSWVSDLPHALDEDRERALVATNREDAKRILEALAGLLRDRRLELEADNSYSAPPLMLPYFLIVVTQPAFLTKDNPINEFLLRGPELGAGLIMAVEDVNQLPKECNLIITARDGAGVMFHKDDAANRREYMMDMLQSVSLSAFSRRLRRTICEEAGKKTPVPKSYSFYQMQGISRAGDWDIGRHWQETDITKGICAPLGMGEGGELVSLDLHESAHGPHGLVAGTTGSGKSEVMLSYLLSLALRYHPYELGFVIIDFKGGGMANRLAELPHLIGTITNIEGAAINRSLASIKAELLKRQRLFAEAGVDSIDKYIRAVKEGKARTPLPHLVIIVDEFAELKAQQPEFMSELISAARIGRSLGIHLILATQKPAGQVSDQIWSNSRFQICLKVATREDSNDVIKSPLALSIKEAGRAYLRVGNNEVFELFQSGYSGGNAPDGGGSELERVVAHIADFCRRMRITRLPPICLPELQERIVYPEEAAGRGKLLPIGVFDDPDQQCQGVQGLDVFGKNTFILGSSLSGKTNLLQLILRGAAERYSPAEVNIYVLDFASMMLKTYETLAQVGGVVTSLEDEKLKNLLRLLNAEIEDRQAKFLELGVSSFRSYLEAGRTDKARILLLIDNLTALRELYFQDDDALLPLCQTGLTYGISVVATNVQTAGIGYKYMANFANRIAMFCNDPGEYASLFEHCTLRIPDLHGRCIVDQDKRLLQCQTYLAFQGEREVDRAEAIRAWSASLNRRSEIRAVPIPEIPEKMAGDMLIRAALPGMRRHGNWVVGLDYETVSPVSLDLERLGLLGITGTDPESARALLRHLLRTAELVFPESAVFYLVDGLGRGLIDCKGHPSVAAYEFLPAKAPELVKTVEAELARRYEALMQSESDLEREKLLVLVLTGGAAIEAVGADAAAMTSFKNILGKYKALKVCVLLSECDNAAINYSSPEPLKKLKEEQKLVFFGDLSNLKLFDVPYTAIKKFKKPIERGDAYLIRGGECLRMKTPEDRRFDAD